MPCTHTCTHTHTHMHTHTHTYSPCDQIKRMFKETRAIASTLMLVMIVLTICAGVPGVMFKKSVEDGGTCSKMCAPQ